MMRRPRHRWVRACAQRNSDLPRGGTADVTGDYRHCTKPRSATVSAASPSGAAAIHHRLPAWGRGVVKGGVTGPDCARPKCTCLHPLNSL